MNNTLKIFLGILITFLVLVLSSGFEIGLKSLFKGLPFGVGSQIGIFTLSVGLLLIFTNKGIISFTTKKVKLKQLLLPIGLTILLLLINQVVLFFLGNEQHSLTVSLSLLQQLVFFVVLASIGEELLFRGFLLKMLDSLKGFGINFLKTKLSLPVLLSGVLFGFIHFGLLATGVSFKLVFQIVTSGILLGIIAGYFQEKNKNFIFAFLVHATANLMGIALSLL